MPGTVSLQICGLRRVTRFVRSPPTGGNRTPIRRGSELQRPCGVVDAYHPNSGRPVAAAFVHPMTASRQTFKQISERVNGPADRGNLCVQPVGGHQDPMTANSSRALGFRAAAPRPERDGGDRGRVEPAPGRRRAEGRHHRVTLQGPAAYAPSSRAQAANPAYYPKDLTRGNSPSHWPDRGCR